MSELLMREAGETLDCRLIEAPEVEIELPGKKLTLHAANYMRRLPLREGVSVSSAQGVFVPSNETNATLNAPSSSDPVGQNSSSTNNTGNATLSTAVAGADSDEQVRRFCSPRLMP